MNKSLIVILFIALLAFSWNAITSPTHRAVSVTETKAVVPVTSQTTSATTQPTVQEVTPIMTATPTESVSQGFGAMVYHGSNPPYMLADKSRVILTRNDKATNPTWEQLTSFMAQDQTDQIQYNSTSFVCSDYAERIYNNAEAKGIRAAFVALSFQDGGAPHALDAFQTTDRGLVFIDSTGPDTPFTIISNPGVKQYGTTSNYDKIGYVQIGQPYEVVSMSTNWGTNYPDYSRWEGAVKKFKTDLANYNAEMENHNAGIQEYNANPLLINKYYELKDEETHLNEESTRINQDGSRLGGFWDHLNGAVPVSHIEIYW